MKQLCPPPQLQRVSVEAELHQDVRNGFLCVPLNQQQKKKSFRETFPSTQQLLVRFIINKHLHVTASRRVVMWWALVRRWSSAGKNFCIAKKKKKPKNKQEAHKNNKNLNPHAPPHKKKLIKKFLYSAADVSLSRNKYKLIIKFIQLRRVDTCWVALSWWTSVKASEQFRVQTVTMTTSKRSWRFKK